MDQSWPIEEEDLSGHRRENEDELVAPFQQELDDLLKKFQLDERNSLGDCLDEWDALSMTLQPDDTLIPRLSKIDEEDQEEVDKIQAILEEVRAEIKGDTVSLSAVWPMVIPLARKKPCAKSTHGDDNKGSPSWL